MNKPSKCGLVIGGKVYVAWKQKMLHDVIGGHQAIYSKKERKKEKRWGIQFCSWLRPRTVHVLRKARARRDYKLSSLGKIFLNTRKAISRLRKQPTFHEESG